MPAASPPPTDPLVALADRCVQCGLCLPVCPTYASDRLEAESPRGRIAIMRGLALGAIAASDTGDAHLDHCLACRSCEAVCPAGVQYGALLGLQRTRQRARRGARLSQRTIEWLTARPAWLSTLLALYRWGFPWMPGWLRRLPRPPAPPTGSNATRLEAALPSRAPGRDALPRGNGTSPTVAPAPAATVALFAGCAGHAFEAPVRAQLAVLCRDLGYRVTDAPGQTCCGTLHRHAGDADAASRLAMRNAAALRDVDHVLTLASGCHEAVAEAAGARSEDAIAFLGRHLQRLDWASCGDHVAVHLPCTQRNITRTVPALRHLLAAVPGLKVTELSAGSGCCGAAGTAMLQDPARAAGYRQPLLDQLAASGANRLLSANLGCRLHLGTGTAVTVEHPLEFLLGLARIKNTSPAAS